MAKKVDVSKWYAPAHPKGEGSMSLEKWAMYQKGREAQIKALNERVKKLKKKKAEKKIAQPDSAGSMIKSNLHKEWKGHTLQ
jgi:hypothetical protein